MIDAFMWIGFICTALTTLAITYYVVAFVAYYASVKTLAVVKLFRRIWRFYKTLPNTKFGREGRYWSVIYDKETGGFTHTQALNSSYQTEEEYAEMIAEFKRNNTRKRGVKVDAT